MDASQPIRTAVLRGAFFIIVSELMFALMGVGVRFLSTSLSNETLVFFRNLFGLLLLLPWIGRQGLRGLGTKVLPLHLLRGLAGLAAMYCFFYALAHLPLSEAMLLKLTAPLFIPFLALSWLKEPISFQVGSGLLVGFAGVLLVLNPGWQPTDPAAMIALLGGFFAAIVQVDIRRLSSTEPGPRIVFYFAAIGTLASIFPLPWAWSTPSGPEYLALFAIAGFATLGQLFMTQGLAIAPAAPMGAFSYFSVIFAAIFGWLFWAEQPGISSLIGTGLVILAGVLVGRWRRGPQPLPDGDSLGTMGNKQVDNG